MSYYRPGDAGSSWEPIPWDLDESKIDEQELGFYQRAAKQIRWERTPFSDFPTSGIFGHGREWFASLEIVCYATFEGEDLILIQNTVHGFPDPPEWGLASRPAGQLTGPWSPWGYFPDLPSRWTVPEAAHTPTVNSGVRGGQSLE